MDLEIIRAESVLVLQLVLGSWSASHELFVVDIFMKLASISGETLFRINANKIGENSAGSTFASARVVRTCAISLPQRFSCELFCCF